MFWMFFQFPFWFQTFEVKNKGVRKLKFEGETTISMNGDRSRNLGVAIPHEFSFVSDRLER